MTRPNAGPRLDRRVLLGAAVAGPLLPFPGNAPAAAAQPLRPSTNSGCYHFRIGDIPAVVVSDGTLAGNPRIYAGDAPHEDLNRVLAGAFLPTNTFTLNLNTLLLEVAGRRVLIEAGAGTTMGPNGGRVFANLAAVGVAPADIDSIVVTHTHPDHVGNLRGEDGRPAFPNAAVHLPVPDWDFFIRNDPDLSRLPMDADFRTRFIGNIRRSVEPIAANVSLYTPGAELMPGIATIPAGGHTPGMSAVLVHSGRDQLLVTSDAAYSPLLNMERPWRPGPDLDPEAADQVRHRLFDRAAAEGALVLGFHFPFPGLGRIRADGGRYTWVPSPWQFAI